MQKTNHLINHGWILPLTIAIVLTILQFAGFSDLLRFDREAIDAGQWWLIFSGNFVHLGNNHLWLNLVGFLLIYFLFWSNYTFKQWLLIICLSSLTVGNGLYFGNPELHWYVGFSGTLHGLIIAGAIADMRHYAKSAGLLLALVIVKLGWEQLYGSMPGSAEIAGGNVVVDSHLYGAIGGGICAAILLSLDHFRHKKPR